MTTEQLVNNWFAEHADEMAKTLQTLVRIPSVAGTPEPGAPNGREVARALDLALEMARGFGFETEDYDREIGAAVLPGTSGKELGLIAHLDVVPVGESGWTFPPFEGHIDENGWIVGRGTCDNKSGAVIALFVMRCIRELGLPFPHGIRLLFGCNEETSMRDVEYYGAHGKHADLYLVPDAEFPACYAEKGIWGGDLRSPKLAESGILGAYAGMASNVVPDKAWIELAGYTAKALTPLCEGADVEASDVEGGARLTAKGAASHAAYPEESRNAIYVLLDFVDHNGLLAGEAAAAAAFLRDVLSDYKGEALGIASEHPDTGYLTAIGGMLRYDGALTLNLNVRYPRSITGEEITARVAAVAASAGFELAGAADNKGVFRSPDDPLVATLTGIYNKVTGQDEKPYMMGGGTYARHLPNALAFGPELTLDGLPECPYQGEVHMPDEHYHVRQLTTAGVIYTLSFLAIAENPAIL